MFYKEKREWFCLNYFNKLYLHNSQFYVAVDDYIEPCAAMKLDSIPLLVHQKRYSYSRQNSLPLTITDQRCVKDSESSRNSFSQITSLCEYP